MRLGEIVNCRHSDVLDIQQSHYICRQVGFGVLCEKRPSHMEEHTQCILYDSPVNIQNDPPQIATEFIPPPQVSDNI